MKSKEQWYEWAKKYAEEDNDWLDDTDSELYSEMAHLLANKCSDFMTLLIEVQEQLKDGAHQAGILVDIEKFIRDNILQED